MGNKKKKKRTSGEPWQVVDRAIYHLWETINDLEQIHPQPIEHFRVSIFGSSRIRRGDPIYEDVRKLCYELSQLGIDVLICGSLSIDLSVLISSSSMWVIPGITGDVEEILQAFLNNTLFEPGFRMPGAVAEDRKSQERSS